MSYLGSKLAGIFGNAAVWQHQETHLSIESNQCPLIQLVEGYFHIETANHPH